jgi:hypothetical protein
LYNQQRNIWNILSYTWAAPVLRSFWILLAEYIELMAEKSSRFTRQEEEGQLYHHL